MGDVTIYLIPTSEVHDPIASRSQIIDSLHRQMIIDSSRSPFYPDSVESDCFQVGDSHLAAFDIDEDEVDVAFQQCEIYGHPTEISLLVESPDGVESLVKTNLFVGFHETGGYSQIKDAWLRSFSDEHGIDFKAESVWST